jgi:hypothetical protein
MHTESWLKDLFKSGFLKYQGHWTITLRWKIWNFRWMQLAQDYCEWRTLALEVIKLRGLLPEKYLVSWAFTQSVSRLIMCK